MHGGRRGNRHRQRDGDDILHRPAVGRSDQAFGQTAGHGLRIGGFELFHLCLVLGTQRTLPLLELGLQRLREAVADAVSHLEPGKLAELRPEQLSLFGERHHLGRNRQPAQPALAGHRVDERHLTFPARGVELQVLVERHHVVVPALGWHLAEVDLEAALGGGPVRDGEGQLHRRAHAIVCLVLERVGGPPILDGRIALEAEAIREGGSRVRVVGQEREGPALEREAPGLPRPVVGQAVLDRAGGVQIEHGGSPRLKPAQHAGDEVRRRRLRGLMHERPPMRDREQRHLLPHLLLAVLRRAVGRHVRDLARVPAGARLAAGVRVDLRVEHHHANRLPRCEQPRQVLEPDVEHRAVTAHGHDGRTERELLVGEARPVEGGELLVVDLRLKGVGQFQLGAAHRHEAVGHLSHVPLEDADGHRGRVLEQVVHPREGIGVVGIRAGPHRRAAGGVGHPQMGAATAARPFRVAPPQIREPVDQLGNALQPDPRRRGDGHVHVLGRRRAIQVCARGEQLAALGVQLGDERVQVDDVLLHARLHQRVDRPYHQVDRGLLAAAHAGAVAADHREIVLPLQQQRRQRADPLLQVGDVDVAVGGVGQPPPERPIAA